MKKERIGDLCFFGGKQAFPNKLFVGRPNIGDRAFLHKHLDDILNRKWLTNDGVYIARFEEKLASYLGVKHCIALCNGTIALQIAFKALELRGEVIVPSFTFVATAHALQWQGIKPVFCDVDPVTFTLDPNHARELITPQTSAILGVHLWGRGCDAESIEKLARQHQLRIVYDACHAFACSHNGQKIGHFGDMEVFSFHATKVFNSFEGGAIVTNNDALAKRIRLLKNFGFSDTDQVSFLGINGKMNEMSAIMGLAGLDSLPKFLQANKENYLAYKKALSGIKGVRLMEYDDTNDYNYHNIVLDVDSAIAGVDRDCIVDLLMAEGVFARRYFYPGCHKMEPYNSNPIYQNIKLPVTERLTTRLFSLPTGTSVNKGDIQSVAEIIRLIVDNSEEINTRIHEERQPATEQVIIDESWVG